MEYEFAYFFPESPARRWMAKVALEPLVCGYASEKSSLEEFHPFRADPYFRLYRPLAGEIVVVGCDGEMVIRPGENFLFPAEVPFRYRSRGGFTHQWVHFTSDQLRLQPRFQRFLSAPPRPEEAALWQALLDLAATRPRDFGTMIEVESILKKLLVPFWEMPEPVSEPPLAELERFQPALDCIMRHLNRPVETPELARLCGMTRNAFSKKFREIFGTPPKQYVTRMRVESAKKLLLTTNLAVKEVALRCGFESAGFFFRVFREQVHLSPQQFRAKFFSC